MIQILKIFKAVSLTIIDIKYGSHSNKLGLTFNTKGDYNNHELLQDGLCRFVDSFNFGNSINRG